MLPFPENVTPKELKIKNLSTKQKIGILKSAPQNVHFNIANIFASKNVFKFSEDKCE